MSVCNNKQWHKIDLVLGCLDGLPGITSKLEVGDYNIYVKTAWFKGKIVHIDITVSRGRGENEGLPVSGRQATLETTRYELARAWIETSCRMASTMLQMGEVEIEDIIEEWNGVSGYPQGYCWQLPATNSETGEIGPTFQRGPLHAAAKLIQKRIGRWTEQMKDTSESLIDPGEEKSFIMSGQQKGGFARAANLSADRRREIAKRPLKLDGQGIP